MASMGYGATRDQAAALMGLIKHKFLVPDLRELCRHEGLTVSGTKPDLHHRVNALLNQLVNGDDVDRLNQLRAWVNCKAGVPTQYSPAPSFTASSPSSLSPLYHNSTPRISQPYSPNPTYNMASTSGYSNRVNFRNSPFYMIIRPLTTVVECRARESTRDTARLTITLAQDVADRLARDTDTRVMVFCAADNSLPPHTASEIAFPHQVELKCNTDEVKANLRGLKNKPGSTRPADITNLVRKKPNYQNNVEMIYALTTKIVHAEQAKPNLQKFYLVVNLVQRRPIEGLVRDLEKGKMICKERVVREMVSKNQDSDIVATSTVLSLKCPLSAMRISVPCRASSCSHNQCFDAASYLQLQEQAPTWTCPICNKNAKWEDLTIDHYVRDILQNTSSETEQVTIEPDGRWHVPGAQLAPGNNNPTPDDDDADYDFFEIPDARVSHLKTEAYATTPPLSSRAESSTPSASRPNKRPASEVIDLTLSDEDDDDPALRAKIKRPSMSTSDVLHARHPINFPFHSPRPSPTFTRDFSGSTLSR